MRCRVTTIMAVLSMPILGGCGTVSNLTGGEPRVYGGVRTDIEENGLQSWIHDAGEANNNPRAGIVVYSLAAVELGLTFTGDTLTLPLTSAIQACREDALRAKDDEESNGAPNNALKENTCS